MSANGGIIGVSDHGGWAVLVTVARDGTLLDRRRVELVDDALPAIPHHHEGQRLPVEPGRGALVERVRVSAERHAALALDAVAAAVQPILGVALRNCQQLPPTIAERIKDYRARNVADWVMYRKALAAAAAARGWSVHWYDAKKIGRSRPGVRRREFRRSLSRICARPSGRHGTTITSLQWQRPSSPRKLGLFLDAVDENVDDIRDDRLRRRFRRLMPPAHRRTDERRRNEHCRAMSEVR